MLHSQNMLRSNCTYATAIHVITLVCSQHGIRTNIHHNYDDYHWGKVRHWVRINYMHVHQSENCTVTLHSDTRKQTNKQTNKKANSTFVIVNYCSTNFPQCWNSQSARAAVPTDNFREVKARAMLDTLHTHLHTVPSPPAEATDTE